MAEYKEAGAWGAMAVLTLLAALVAARAVALDPRRCCRDLCWRGSRRAL